MFPGNPVGHQINVPLIHQGGLIVQTIRRKSAVSRDLMSTIRYAGTMATVVNLDQLLGMLVRKPSHLPSAWELKSVVKLSTETSRTSSASRQPLIVSTK